MAPANDPFRFSIIIQTGTFTHLMPMAGGKQGKQEIPMRTRVMRFSRAPEVVLSLSFIGIVFAYIAASSALA